MPFIQNNNDLDTILVLDRLTELEAKIDSGLCGFSKFSNKLTPRGLSRKDAAAYVGISASKFDSIIIDGLMPNPVRIGARTIWDRDELDECFDKLKTTQNNSDNPWDDICRERRVEQ